MLTLDSKLNRNLTCDETLSSHIQIPRDYFRTASNYERGTGRKICFVRQIREHFVRIASGHDDIFE